MYFDIYSIICTLLLLAPLAFLIQQPGNMGIPNYYPFTQSALLQYQIILRFFLPWLNMGIQPSHRNIKFK